MNNQMNSQLNRQMNRRQLLNHINQVSFAVNDVTLYLDTHPCDPEALEYLRKMSRQRNEALKEYRCPSTQQRIPVQNAGTGSMSHGHGRKEDADLCGTMKKDFNIL